MLIDIEIDYTVLSEDILREIEAVRISEMQKVRNVAEMVGHETIAFLRSKTGETQPPLRAGQPSRRAHPGGWADVSGNLALAYEFEILEEPDGWLVHFRNGMEYAAILEARDGYFVLRGVTDPGGPVDRALRIAIARIAPDWTVQ
jgi:hypothetical protein